MTKLMLALAAATLVGTSASAAPPKANRPAAVKDLDACRKIADTAARLACYDRSVAALTDAVSAGDVAVVDREENVKTRRSLFGFALPQLTLLGRRGDKDEPEIKKIASTVISSTGLPNGRYLMKIADNNSVWETIENSDSLSVPLSGDKVAIEKGALGAYFMQIGSQRWVRARRVR